MQTTISLDTQLRKNFFERFGTQPRLFRAPGRVNLIGEHTDYNDGFVFPAAIDRFTWVAAARRPDRRIVFRSENMRETAEINLDALPAKGAGKWPDYPIGVAWALENAGLRLCGANLSICSSVPIGSGLSSSAALEVSVGYALLDLAGYMIDRKQLALLCQRAENDYAGARCGIMDQFVACHGQAGRALLLDCRSLEYRACALPQGIRLVVCNTMVGHELGASAYNQRRAECEEGVRLLSAALPGIRALRDVSAEQLAAHRNLLPDVVYKRCLHVVTENERVHQFAQALQANETSKLGPLLAASHASLRDDYEVSCRELDLMVEIAWRQPGVCGARMTGGGFGGCTINLVEESNADLFQHNVAAEYAAGTGKQPEVYICDASRGVTALGADGNSAGAK
jgi:galactokinase